MPRRPKSEKEQKKLADDARLACAWRRHAGASRHKASPEAAPPIIACRFERDGELLAQRNGERQ